MARKVATVVGARPQFIKVAAVERALAGSGLQQTLIHTGQHFDPELSDNIFSELSIRPPDYNLGVHGGPHGQMTGRMLEAIERVLIDERPAIVLVFGDTNSTLAGALAARKLNIPVAHVEAGLRSLNRRMPEETNRVVTDHISDLLFCPTSAAVANLQREGITSGVILVGDVMYDAALHAQCWSDAGEAVGSALGLPLPAYDVATLHRAENTDDGGRFREIIEYLKWHSKDRPIIFPVHPRTRAAARRHGVDLVGLRVCPPLGYFEMMQLLRGASRVFTDSGGLQKEAYFLRVPCVTLREETEWVETIDAGWNRLWRVDSYEPRRDIQEYGDGNAGSRIVEAIVQFLASSST